MKKFSLGVAALLLSACQAPQLVDKDYFYFGEVIEKNDTLLWQDCISGTTHPVKGVKEASQGPLSVIAHKRIGKKGDTLEVHQIVGAETQGNCEEHGNAELQNTLWELAYWSHTKQPEPGELKLTITEDQQIRGNWQCHEFTGEAQVNEAKLSWPVITWSSKACDDKQSNKALESLPASFQGPWRAAIYGNTLVLTSPLGEKAIFRALYL